MKRELTIISVLLLATTTVASETMQERQLRIEEYRDKMAGGWVGQMIGVGWAGPTEFKYKGRIIPEESVPVWEPTRVNQFRQDDIYVEMTFLRSMELYGLDVSLRQAGIDFANSGYSCAHANRHGRENLRKGIAPPDSGHPRFNHHADDIDYQIEADYAGLISPGMPNIGIALGDKFGRLMNYGDGLYGGQFVAGMYAAAFFEDDMRTVVQAGLDCVPAESQFAETIRDLLKWHAELPDNWQATWEKVERKYQENENYRLFSCNRGYGVLNHIDTGFNIDAKINAAYIVMGLLYGEGSVGKTIVISMRCGQDSDCNPSNAAGVLCTAIGMKNLPSRFTSELDQSIEFSHTAYDFDSLLAVCENLARETVILQGGHIERDALGKETFVIPVRRPKPSSLEQCWEPGPIANSRFTDAEMARITVPPAEVIMARDLEEFAPGWEIKDYNRQRLPLLMRTPDGTPKHFRTIPKNAETPCVLSKRLALPDKRETKLNLTVSARKGSDWELVVKVNGDQIFLATVEEQKMVDHQVNLSSYMGQTIDLEVLNQPSGWDHEFANWRKLEIVSTKKGGE